MAVPRLLRIQHLNHLISSFSDTNNNGQSENSISKKCLFGAADPDDTARLVEEQFEEERRRFVERFGFEMHELDALTSPTRRKSLKMAREKAARQSRVLKPYNLQTKMTDYCQIKKTPPPQPQQPSNLPKKL